MFAIDLPPPGADDLVPIDREVPLSRGRYLLDRQEQYRGRIVKFSLQLSATVDGRREVIAQIHTSHGTVQMRTFARGGREDVRVIQEIPMDAPGDFLDNAYLTAYEYLVSGATGLVEAWHGQRSASVDEDELGPISRG